MPKPNCANGPRAGPTATAQRPNFARGFPRRGPRGSPPGRGSAPGSVAEPPSSSRPPPRPAAGRGRPCPPAPQPGHSAPRPSAVRRRGEGPFLRGQPPGPVPPRLGPEACGAGGEQRGPATHPPYPPTARRAPLTAGAGARLSIRSSQEAGAGGGRSGSRYQRRQETNRASCASLGSRRLRRRPGVLTALGACAAAPAARRMRAAAPAASPGSARPRAPGGREWGEAPAALGVRRERERCPGRERGKKTRGPDRKRTFIVVPAGRPASAAWAGNRADPFLQGFA